MLKYLLGTAFRAEALSRPARSASFLPFCCRRAPFGWRSLWANECGLGLQHLQGKFSALKLCHGPPVRPLFFLSAAGALLLVGARCGQTSAAWKSAGSEAFVAPSGPIALLHIGLKCDVRHSAAALLWFVLAAAKRVRPPSALDAKLFLLVAPWGPIAVYFLYSTPLVGARCGQTSAAWKSAENKQTSKQASKQASQQA